MGAVANTSILDIQGRNDSVTISDQMISAWLVGLEATSLNVIATNLYSLHFRSGFLNASRIVLGCSAPGRLGIGAITVSPKVFALPTTTTKETTTETTTVAPTTTETTQSVPKTTIQQRDIQHSSSAFRMSHQFLVIALVGFVASFLHG